MISTLTFIIYHITVKNSDFESYSEEWIKNVTKN